MNLPRPFSVLTMSNSPLLAIYKAYIEAINSRASLEPFVHPSVTHNDRSLTLAGYEAFIQSALDAAPDLHFNATMTIANGNTLAARIEFDCVPQPPEFLGLKVSDTRKRVVFAENVFYQFREDKIEQVWSVVDVKSVESQLNATSSE